MLKAEHRLAVGRGHLDTRRALDSQGGKESIYPVKLEIYWNKKRRYYSISVDPCSKSDWEKVKAGKRLTDFQQGIHDDVQIIEAEAAKVIKELNGSFSFENFKETFFIDRSVDKNDAYAAFQAYIDKLIKEGRKSTAVSYECALTSLKKFKPSLSLDEVTPPFLQRYEDWMLGQGRSQNTIGMYLRSFRSVLNVAKSKGYIDEKSYPFGKTSHGKYQIPASQNVKKALTKEEIQLIKDYEAKPGSRAEAARDWWLFAYFTNGLNVKDIAHLKWENIDYESGMVRFVRKKTERSKKGNSRQIQAALNDFTKAVIAQYGKNGAQDDFVFPILKKRMTPDEAYNATQNFTRKINKGMKVVAEDLGITKPTTTYAARHSFATILYRSGVSVGKISSALDHSSARVTQNYLDHTTDGEVKDMASLL